MMADWQSAGEAIGRQAQARAIARGAVRLRDEFPDLTVSAEADAITLSGRGLYRRWMTDARLRAIGSILK